MERSSLNQMARFSLRFILILLLILIFDQGIGVILKHFYFRQKFGEQSQLTYVIDSTVADMLIFGSSRASHHYIPEIFEKSLNNTCFNTGKDGNYFLYSYALFKTIVKRYNPKLVIFDIRPYELGDITYEYERLSLLLPYYQKYPEIRHIIDLRGPLEKYKHISAIYSFNSVIFQVARGNLKHSKTSEPDLKGYIPLYRTMNHEKIGTWDLCNITFDENKIHALNDIISTCKQKNIELIFVNSPIWVTIQYSSCKNFISDMCSEQGIEYIDMSNDSTFINNPYYFDDISHLNNEGATIFTNMLISKMHINY
jgi:cell division protein FtsL